MNDRNIVIDHLDTLADGVLEPRTGNFLAAYDSMRIELGADLDKQLINLLALIVRLGDMGEEHVSLKELKATRVNEGTLPADIDDGLRQLNQAGFVHMIEIIDDAEGDTEIILSRRFPLEPTH